MSCPTLDDFTDIAPPDEFDKDTNVRKVYWILGPFELKRDWNFKDWVSESCGWDDSGWH